MNCRAVIFRLWNANKITSFRSLKICGLYNSKFSTHDCVGQWPVAVKIVEVGPRDGLQNEPGVIPTATKIELINRLSDAGLQSIEATAFVSKKWVPQMGDSDEVAKGIKRKEGVNYSALTPNMKGLEGALAADIKEVAVFGAASEAFSKKNINCSIAESMQRFSQVTERAIRAGVRVRGYVSCALGCPYQGQVEPGAVAEVTESLLDLGCYEVSIADTTGVGTPGSTLRLLRHLKERKWRGAPFLEEGRLAVHFHDTYGQALPNILVALQEGINVVDSSVAGLGGCPYAKGASGNVATEDVLYMLHGMGIATGVDIDAVISAGHYISQKLGKMPNSRLGVVHPPSNLH
uniref:hydroxymethylglutaryl-CoA lyase n=1 Tax=Fibrocapsa japonica TaxID=94617 RepID=A0A7S2UXZ5_9STRA|mmetsp:Transcript_15564/g.22886  ORF Transcript_15564/g.22886 Transcript_15564/m.22886 type:complete len:348 (+) Transcript_15564:88-1131(+)